MTADTPAADNGPADERPGDHTPYVRAWAEGRRAAELASSAERLQAMLDATAEDNDRLTADRDRLSAELAEERAHNLGGAAADTRTETEWRVHLTNGRTLTTREEDWVESWREHSVDWSHAVQREVTTTTTSWQPYQAPVPVSQEDDARGSCGLCSGFPRGCSGACQAVPVSDQAPADWCPECSEGDEPGHCEPGTCPGRPYPEAAAVSDQLPQITPAPFGGYIIRDQIGRVTQVPDQPTIAERARAMGIKPHDEEVDLATERPLSVPDRPAMTPDELMARLRDAPVPPDVATARAAHERRQREPLPEYRIGAGLDRPDTQPARRPAKRCETSRYGNCACAHCGAAVDEACQLPVPGARTESAANTLNRLRAESSRHQTREERAEHYAPLTQPAPAEELEPDEVERGITLGCLRGECPSGDCDSGCTCSCHQPPPCDARIDYGALNEALGRVDTYLSGRAAPDCPPLWDADVEVLANVARLLRAPDALADVKAKLRHALDLAQYTSAAVGLAEALAIVDPAPDVPESER